MAWVGGKSQKKDAVAAVKSEEAAKEVATPMRILIIIDDDQVKSVGGKPGRL